MYISFKPNNTIFYFALRSQMVFKELQKGKMKLCESRNISICIYTCICIIIYIPHIPIPASSHFKCFTFLPLDLNYLLVSLPFSLRTLGILFCFVFSISCSTSILLMCRIFVYLEMSFFHSHFQ